MNHPLVNVYTPVRAGTHPDLLHACMEAVDSQDYPNKRHTIRANNYPTHDQKFGNHARARNEMLDDLGDHNLVMWVDADIVAMPTDTITRLVRHVYERPATRHVIAPQVRIQQTEATGNVYNDWFYDIAAFVKADGRPVDSQWRPTETGLIPMKSVGCVYMVYRGASFARYRPEGNDVEHISYLKHFNVFVDPTLVVKHANLPAYGLRWH